MNLITNGTLRGHSEGLKTHPSCRMADHHLPPYRDSYLGFLNGMAKTTKDPTYQLENPGLTD